MLLMWLACFLAPADCAGFLRNTLSGRCLDVDGLPGKDNHANLQLWNCECGQSETDQLWRLDSNGFLINMLSNKCVDVDGLPGIWHGSTVVPYAWRTAEEHAEREVHRH